MFLRFTTRKKSGKEHRYYSLVENRRVASGRVIQRHALYLGEINDCQQEAWRKTIEIFEEGPGHALHVEPPVLEETGVLGRDAGVQQHAIRLEGGTARGEEGLAPLGVGAAAFEAPGPGWLHPRHSARVRAGDAVLGELGELHPRVADAFELPRGVLAFRLSLDALLGAARLVPSYRPIPRLPAVLRDLAVVVDEAVTAAAVEALVREEALVEAVTLFDVYRGAPLPPGRKNLALAITYRAPDRTLTDAEADAAHARIVERLARGVGAELRG